ncbi:MAG TPA: hypothetical protein VGQ30_11040, partial [Gemmatimonadaceae bacterium]|nr:hypothetical protein [Gemmatimonadaceae bacterium]
MHSPVERRRRGGLGASGALAILALSLMIPVRLFAQGGVLVQGIVDAEMWSTDSGSSLLTKNHARPGGLGRLDLWGAVEPWRGLVIYAQGEGAAGPAQNDRGRADYDLEQAGVRWSPTGMYALDIGKMPDPVGTFAARRFSTRNPLIGEPDGYPVVYPLGAQFSAANTHFDFRIAAVSLPLTHPGYVPDPSAALRPAVGAGFTPFTGLRIGASGTWGPYLNASLPAPLLAGQSWQHFQQRIAALDLAYSHDYLEVHAEYARGSYDVPGFSDPVAGETWYVEAKRAFGPRVFVAARVERNNYPFIAPAGPSTWIGSDTDFDDGEIGAGYRVSASLLVKASYRMDHWYITPAQRAFLGPGGHAFAVQFSQSFDVLAVLAG